MAAERSVNLKELVRRIIHNINRTETGNGGANTQSASVSVPNRANSTNEELNQRFMLPRSREAPLSSNSTRVAQNVAAEFNPNNNYGYTNYRSRQPSRQRNYPNVFSRQRSTARSRSGPK